jgi:acyl-CoA synthetase (AMP-forming)/AMP-acid ligase II
VPGVTIAIVDDDGRPLPPGTPGEIVIRSPHRMAEYFRDPAQTAEALRDGWFHTGDLGTLDADGWLYFVDRKRDVIRRGGENMSSALIEKTLCEHPAVAEAAVIGVPDESWGEAVKAVVVKKPGAEVTAGEMISWARERIAGYKLPKSVDFVEALPRNPTGKILKRELRKPYWGDKQRQVN